MACATLSEPWEEGALITTGQRVSEEATDKNGVVRVGGLQPYPGRSRSESTPQASTIRR